jgi:N utilization substance protein A
MKVVLNTETIGFIDLFQNLTGSQVVDCLDHDETLYFVVKQGQYGLAIGRKGNKIKNAEKVFKKKIKIFEYSPDLKQFVKNIIPEAEEIEIKHKLIKVKVKNSDKPRVIGRGGTNIKVMRYFLERLFDMENLRIE